MLKQYNFNRDLKIGEIGEKLFAKYIQSNAPILYENIQFNNDYRFDIIADRVDGVSHTFEIKFDEHPRNINNKNINVAIELFCLRREQPTGLLKSQADYFVYIFNHNLSCYIGKTETIKKYIKTQKLKLATGGENNNAILALIPVYEYRKITKHIKL